MTADPAVFLTRTLAISIAARASTCAADRFTLEHRIVSHRLQAVVTEGEGTIVTFHYGRGEKVPMPDELRRRITELEATAR